MRAGRLWAIFWSVAGAVSVRVKIMGIVLGLVLLLGLGVTLQVRLSMNAMLGDELAKRGISLTRDLAARSADLILTNNTFVLYELLRDTLENNPDVRYAFILDASGNVLLHTFGTGLPVGLAESNAVGPKERYHLEVLDTEEGLIRDIAVPILDGRAGTARVGMSDRRLQGMLAATTRQLLIATALVSLMGVVAAYLLTLVLTRPIQELVEVTKAVVRGDWGRQSSVWARDEIGHLSLAFNAMTQHLALFNQQILQSNKELAALNEELQRKEELRRQLLSKVINAQEEERKRIARELHDETSQSIASLMVGLKIIEGATRLDEVKDKTAELRSTASRVLEGVHDLALELRPSVLDDLGLVEALKRYVKEYSRKHGIEIDFHSSGLEGVALPPEMETSLYRIIQEALTNVARHAQAATASVLLEQREDAMVAIIEDDGKGFNVKRVMGSRSKERKLGLFGMQERASLIGGKLTIESQPGLGTTVFVEVPLDGIGGGVDG
ncbi:MAG: histidine kinase [Chloroflexi bacterium]|nr:histidine kinase [Chloroflexota bacterium]